MRLIEKRKFGQDNDIEVPVFVINHAELKILHALITNAKVYLPKALYPDVSRLSSISKTIERYFEDERSKV